MRKQQVIKNATVSVIQVVVTAAVLFLLYRFLLKSVGIEGLGIWSIVLSISSVASIADLGLSASGVKFVAKYLARGEGETVVDVIQTLAISVGVSMGVVILAAYPLVRWILGKVITGQQISEALAILPYALLSLWLLLLTSVLQAGLDGHQRIDIRSTILMSGAVLHLCLCYFLVPSHGLMGLAYARLIQTSVVLVVSWLMLKRCLPKLPVVPCRWSFGLFKEMVGYGVNFQIITVFRLLYDPITKTLLTKFGGLAFTGYYQMASRMIQQFRSLLVTANQVLVPAIADMKETSPKNVQVVYATSYRLLFYLALPMFSLVIVCAPAISQLWIGFYEHNFVYVTILLSMGWFINTLAGPAYFVNLGTGELKWNTVGHGLIAILNLGAGFVLGHLYGGAGVVFGWVFALAAGSLTIPVAYHLTHRIPVHQLLPRENWNMVAASVLGLCASLVVFQMGYSSSGMFVSGSIVVLFAAILAFPLWVHPMRKRLVEWMPWFPKAQLK